MEMRRRERREKVLERMGEGEGVVVEVVIIVGGGGGGWV